MKTFSDLIEEVQEPGLCHRCGGCVTFCTSINYGALKLGDDGSPTYADREKCIECGLCYSICPEIDEYQEETKKVSGWTPPMGHIIETLTARALDPTIRGKATDGGVVTALLVHLFDRGHIDGAIVTRQTGPFERDPMLATSRQEIIDSAGFYFDSSHGVKHFGHDYSTYSPSVQEFRPMMQKGLRRVALVGTPCQIMSIRRMQALSLVPSESIAICLGLFCSGNFTFTEAEQRMLSEKGGFAWEEVRKINIKDALLVHLRDGEVKRIDLADLESMRRYACRFCPDYSSEFADISFGGIGAEEGWTTVITRSPLGRAVFADARGAEVVEEFTREENPTFASEALGRVRTASAAKKKAARHNRRDLGQKPVVIDR